MNLKSRVQFVIMALVFAPMAYSQITKGINVSEFYKLSVSDEITIYLAQGDKDSVMIKASESNLSKVIITQKDSTLFISSPEKHGFKDRIKNFLSFTKNDTEVFVMFKKLERIEAKNETEIRLKTHIKAEQFTIALSQKAIIDLMGVEALDLKMEAEYSSTIMSSGNIKADRIILTLASGSDGDFKNITSTSMDMEALSTSSIILRGLMENETAKIEASSASDLTLNVKTTNLNLVTNSASSMDIRGTAAVLRAESTGASSIRGKGLLVEKAIILKAYAASKIEVDAKEVLETRETSTGKVDSKITN